MKLHRAGLFLALSALSLPSYATPSATPSLNTLEEQCSTLVDQIDGQFVHIADAKSSEDLKLAQKDLRDAKLRYEDAIDYAQLGESEQNNIQDLFNSLESSIRGIEDAKEQNGGDEGTMMKLYALGMGRLQISNELKAYCFSDF